ncbi:hypothetical protein [Thermaerobacter sp. PB12/4term]|uniref:hypothetical protein n=1 Tax=Thermaerobacter sp. PB12/4term TaxID=2293838 RepID=UPI001FAD398E|nr:hypothetical protein [Thermaerobacter sp. PB12/4term]
MAAPGSRRPSVPASQRRKNRHWPWLPFFDLAVLAALVPGFLLGGVLAAAAWQGWSWASAYPALAQAHGHAQLVGWGGALILGVALQFLPRLRGSTLSDPRRIPLGFMLLAAGLALRVGGQALAALVAAPAARAAGLWILAAGAALEVVAAGLLAGLLARSLRQGPPLGQKKAFAQVAPLFVLAGASLLAGLLLWTLGAFSAATAALRAAAGFNPAAGAGAAAAPASLPAAVPATLPGPVDAAALRLTLFGFIGTISVAMSARVFSLFFRIRPARPGWLAAAAGAFGGALLLDTAAGIGALLTGRPASPGVSAAADLAWGAALVLGTIGVRVFEPRLVFPGDKGGYRWWRDPAGVAAVLAYVWALLAALMLGLRGLGTLGVQVAASTPPADAPLHAVGAGFMTLLIMGVAPTMLPGFGGGRLRSRRGVAVAVALAALAALLRVLPGLGQTLTGRAAPWSTPVMALAGAAGLGAVIALVLVLRASWRTAGAAGDRHHDTRKGR